MQPSLLKIDSVAKSYGNTQALKDVSMSVAAGTCLTLLGPNGSGKTTLIRILAALCAPSSGTVTMFGLDQKNRGAALRRQIGLVSHASFLYPTLSAAENLTFYAQMFGIYDVVKTVEDVLSKVELTSRKHDLVRTFSRGMQQRLSIARALLHQPALLLLDEPYAGLDRAAVNSLQTMFVTLKHEGHTLVLATHRYECGLRIGDKVAILDEGRLMYVGDPAKVRLASQ